MNDNNFNNSNDQNNIGNNKYFRYQFSDFILCPQQRILIKDGKTMRMSFKTYQCLLLLVANANRVVLKNYFFDSVWKDCFVDDGVLAVNISFLRKILGKDKIETFSGRGYKFNDSVTIIEDENFNRQQPINNIPPKQPGFFRRLSAFAQIKSVMSFFL